MSTQTFKGICIGGVAAGRHYECQTTRFAVAQRPARVSAFACEVDAEPTDTREHVTDYVWSTVLGAGVWAPRDWNLADITADLLSNYRPVVGS